MNAELRERVYAFLHDAPRSYFTEEDVDGWLQEGLDDLSSRLRITQKQATGTTNGTIPLPDDFGELVSLQVGSDSIKWVSNDTFSAASGSDVGNIGRIFNRQIELGSVGEDGSYTLRYWSSDGDLNLIRGGLKIRLVNYALSRAKAKTEDFRAAEYYLGLYERGLPAPNDSSVNAPILPDGMTFALGPFDTADSAHN